MTLPISSQYIDPDLWPRLDRVIREKHAEAAQWLIDGRFKTLEENREKVGYLKGLADVLLWAKDENRAERENSPDPRS